MKKILKLVYKIPYQVFAYMVLMAGMISTVNSCKVILGQPEVPIKLKEKVRR